MKINQLVWLLVGMMILVISACNKTTSEDIYDKSKVEVSNQEETKTTPEATAKEDTIVGQTYTYDGALMFVGGASDFEVSYNDIYGMPSIDADVTHTSSTGEVANQTVKGILLEDILQINGDSKQNYSGIRFVAGDGYAVVVPEEVFKSKEVILAYEFDGELIDEKKLPLRVAINDERSMYYVSNLATIELIKDDTNAEERVSEKQVVFMETAFTNLPSQDFMYYDSNDQVIMAKSLIENFVDEPGDFVEFMAADGYEKSEDIDIVTDGFIKSGGEDAPLFTGKDLPKGMNVKSLLRMTVNNTDFMSVRGGMASLETIEVDGDTGVVLSALIEVTGLEADTYIITAYDGYTKEITKDDLEIGMAYLDDSGKVAIKFNDDNPESSKVKGALTMTAGTPAEAIGEVDEGKEEEKEEVAWTVTFEGLSDGSFDFDSGRAERKFEKITLHTERMKNDEKKPEDWEGYRVLDILDWLKVDDFSSLIIVSEDGYEVEIISAMIDEETILADVRNGEAMIDPENKVQLVQNTEFATSWVKGVARIIIK